MGQEEPSEQRQSTTSNQVDQVEESKQPLAAPEPPQPNNEQALAVKEQEIQRLMLVS